MGRVGRALLAAWAIAGVGVACASFGSGEDAADAGVDGGVDAPAPTDSTSPADASDGDASCALSMPPACATPFTTCNSFESADVLDGGMVTTTGGATLAVVCDEKRPGLVLSAAAPASDGGKIAELDFDSVEGSFGIYRVAFSVRAVTPRAAWNAAGITGYASLISMYCTGSPKRGFGIVVDGRGLTFQFDSPDGDFVGFALDTNWHDIDVTLAPTGSSVKIDGNEHVPDGGRPFAGTAPCIIQIGYMPTPTAPAAEYRFDDLRWE